MTALKWLLTAAFLFLLSALAFARPETQFPGGIYQRLDSVIVFGGNEKIHYFYDPSGNQLSSVTLKWSPSEMKYENGNRNEYSYNENGNCILIQQSAWDKTTGQWLPDNKSELTYDQKNQLLSDHHFVWDTLQSTWQLETRTDYTNIYNRLSQLESVNCTTQVRGAERPLISKYDYAYTATAALLTVRRFDMGPDSLKMAEMDQYAYDPEGNLTTRTSSGYHSRRWYFRGTDEFTYNTLVPVSELIIPKDYVTSRFILPAGYRHGSMVTSQMHRFGGLNWTKLYYYSPMEITAVNDTQALEAMVFPNPASEFLNIHWQGNQPYLLIEMFDLTGKKVFAKRVENNSKLPIKDYHEGLYLVRISDSSKAVKTEKVCIKQAF